MRCFEGLFVTGVIGDVSKSAGDGGLENAPEGLHQANWREQDR